MPEEQSAESVVLDSPNDSSNIPVNESTISDSVEVSPDVSGFERLSGLKLGEDDNVGKTAAKPPDKGTQQDKGAQKNKEDQNKLDKPVEVKSKEVEVKEEEVKPVIDNNGIKPKPKLERNYTGLTPAERAVAKEMSNTAFNYYKPLLIEHKQFKLDLLKKDETIKQLQEGKEILPQNYYDNPEAIILSPTYRTAAKNVDISNVIVNHWEQQLMKIEEGLSGGVENATWTDLENDPKTGELRLAGEKPVSIRDKVLVSRYLAQAEHQVGERKQRLNDIVRNFQGEHAKIKTSISNAEKEFFPAYETPDENTKKVLEKAKEAIKNAGIQESNPAFSPLTKSITLNMQMLDYIKSKEREIEELKKKVGIKEGIKRDSIKAGPSSGSLASGSSVNGDNSNIPGYDDFKNRLLP